MHKIPIRFILIRNSHTIEVFLDERLSFNDNIALLSQITDEDLKHFAVYDPFKMIFLDCDQPLKEFNIQGFPLFYLFT